MNNNLSLEEKINILLEESKSRLDYQFSFPKYKTLPPEVLLALQVLQNHGMVVKMSLTNNPIAKK